jgi:hypothetical protein
MKKLTIFILGLVAGAIAAFGTVIYFYTHRPPEDDILFAEKHFNDPNTSEYPSLYISGTLTGKGVAYPNNTYAVACYGLYKACFVSSVEQIGPKHMGRMDGPWAVPIVKWNDYELVAQDEVPLLSCFRTTITIDRKGKSLLWVDEPVNQTKPICKDSDTNMRKYSIEDAPGWKRMREAVRR